MKLKQAVRITGFFIGICIFFIVAIMAPPIGDDFAQALWHNKAPRFLSILFCHGSIIMEE